MGRNLTIEESQGKKPYAGGQAGGQKSYPQGNTAVIETPTLFIGGLSYNSTAESIQAFFSQAGQVASARVVTDKETGKVFPFLFSQEDSDTLSSTMLTPPRRLTLSIMELTSTEEPLDWTALLKEIDLRVTSEDREVSEVAKEDTVHPEVPQETTATQPLF